MILPDVHYCYNLSIDFPLFFLMAPKGYLKHWGGHWASQAHGSPLILQDTRIPFFFFLTLAFFFSLLDGRPGLILRQILFFRLHLPGLRRSFLKTTHTTYSPLYVFTMCYMPHELASYSCRGFVDSCKRPVLCDAKKRWQRQLIAFRKTGRGALAPDPCPYPDIQFVEKELDHHCRKNCALHGYIQSVIPQLRCLYTSY
jgi:hypothetical protein